MRIVRRVNSEEYIKEIINTYLEYLKTSEVSNYDEVAELLRYSICRLLNLDSKGFNSKIDRMSESCIEYLEPIIDKYHLRKRSLDFRHGVLEACVHSMKMSMKYIKE